MSKGPTRRFCSYDQYGDVLSILKRAMQKVVRKELTQDQFLDAIADFLAAVALIRGEKCLSDVMARMKGGADADMPRARTASAGFGSKEK